MRRHARRILLGCLSGLFAGTASAIFLHLLDAATKYRDSHPAIIWALPLIGLLIGWCYYRYGESVAKGNNLVLDEIHDPKKTVPFRMVPFILFGTVFTHLFGGSAGREGTAVQMGASLSDQIAKAFNLSSEERKVMLICGSGAGFGAAIGAPWAGVVFGMEVLYVGKFRFFGGIESLFASFVGYYTSILLQAPHSFFPRFLLPQFSIELCLIVILSGLLFGLTSRLFVSTTHLVQKAFSRMSPQIYLQPFFGGLILIGLYYIEGSYDYVGLGLSHIQSALISASNWKEPVLKMIFTSLTVGSGFKGGEFIPLVFMGTTLGSALSFVMPISLPLLARLGFASVFAGAANTPIACSIMAVELFGYEIAPYALLACFSSYFISGHKGIYHSQRIHARKYRHLKLFLNCTHLFGRKNKKDSS